MNKIIFFPTVTVASVSSFESVHAVSVFNRILLNYNRFRMLTQTLNLNFEETLIETPSRSAFYLVWILINCNSFMFSFKHCISHR